MKDFINMTTHDEGIWADEAVEEWHLAQRLGMLRQPQEVDFEQDAIDDFFDVQFDSRSGVE